MGEPPTKAAERCWEKKQIVMNEPYEKQLNQWLLSVPERTSLFKSLSLSFSPIPVCTQFSVRCVCWPFSHFLIWTLIFVKLALRLRFFFAQATTKWATVKFLHSFCGALFLIVTPTRRPLTHQRAPRTRSHGRDVSCLCARKPASITYKQCSSIYRIESNSVADGMRNNFQLDYRRTVEHTRLPYRIKCVFSLLFYFFAVHHIP